MFAVLRTLRGPDETWTRSESENLVEAGAETVTKTLWVAVPPLPVQARVYVVGAVGETDWVPLVLLVPVQPPLAVQLVAFVLLQVRVVDWPVVTLAGVAVRERVGVVGVGVVPPVACL